MNTTVFVGCSFTKGSGLIGEQASPDLWVNQLHQSVSQLQSTELINLGAGGNNNETIFQDSVEAIITCPTYLFVGWTLFPRITINPGIEMYETKQCWGSWETSNEIRLNKNLIYTKKYLTDVKDKLFDLLNDHYEIIKILKYSTLITNLCLLSNTKVFFINGLIPWDTDYFIKQEETLPSNTTQYTQQLLNADSRDDAEFWMLYNKIHNEYNIAGYPGNNWLNLYQAYNKSFMLDFGTDNLHPGPNSNRAFAEFLTKKLTHYLERI